MVPSLIHLAFAAAIAGHAAAADPAALARSFAEALVADDLPALHALSETGRAGSSFFSVINVLDGRSDIAIASQRVVGTEWDDGVLLVHLELDAVGDDVWRRSRAVPLPSRWTLQAVPTMQGWRLRGAATDDRWLASRLVTADAATIEEGVRRHDYIDRRALLRSLADLASEGGDAGQPAIAWVIAQARASGDLATEALALRQLVHVDLISGRAAAALPGAAQSLALAERAGEPWVLAQARFALGIAHWFNGDIPAAVDLLVASAENLVEHENPRCGLGGLYMATHLESSAGRLRQALALLDRLEAELRRFPWSSGELNATFQRVSLHAWIGNTEVALPLARRAYALADALGDKRSQALALLDEASLTQRLGLPGARELLEDAARIAHTPQAEVPELGDVLNELGHARARDGDVAGAEAAYMEAVELARRRRGAANPGMESEALFGLGGMRLQQGRLGDALRLAQEAVARALAPPAPSAEVTFAWPARTLLGRVLHALGRDTEAEDAFRLAIVEVEDSRARLDGEALARARFLAERLAPYRELLPLLVARGATKEALALSERTRARALEDALAAGHVDLSPAMSEEESAREAALEKALVELNRQRLGGTEPEGGLTSLDDQLADARRELDRFRSELYLRHPQVASRRPPPPDPLAAARQLLDTRSAAIEFFVGERETAAFVVRSAGDDVTVEVRRIAAGRDALGQRTRRLVAALEQRDLGYAQGARELYDLLLAPLAPAFGGVSRLFVVPDGPLWELPFQVLQLPTGEHVAERLALSYAPSLSVLTARAPAPAGPRPTGTLLAIGDPAASPAVETGTRALYRDARLGTLPEAAREVRSIAPLYRGAELRLGTAGSETLFKQRGGEFRVLHLATHGILDDRAPLYSSLLLAPSAADDGLLEAWEILALDLHADLAVLSACDTARGRVGAGEGMIGMSWAFQAAGVPTLVVSQWRADSKATASLMVDFHRRLVAGDAPAEALREAQLALRRDRRYRHPFYWAPFVVVGSGR